METGNFVSLVYKTAKNFFRKEIVQYTMYTCIKCILKDKNNLNQTKISDQS